ncbi:MAG: DUF411 domain-containing protein, partial [Pseudomonadota bacterium]
MSKLVNKQRRRLVGSLLLGSALAGVAAPAFAAQRKMTVYKSPTCGCCVDWIKHLEDNGFTVEAFDVGNSDARERLGMPVRYGSCHTGEIEGYAIEGHVPAREILRLLDEKPQAVGLSVPAMPRGSPGMDGPAYGNIVDPYDVLLIDKDGEAT